MQALLQVINCCLLMQCLSSKERDDVAPLGTDLAEAPDKLINELLAVFRGGCNPDTLWTYTHASDIMRSLCI